MVETKGVAKKVTLYRLYFLAGSLGGLASLIFLLRTPSDPENARLLGFLTARLALAGMVLLPAGILAWLSIMALGRWRDCFTLFLAGSSGVLGVPLVVAARQSSHAILLRLVPVSAWMAVLGAQTALALYFLNVWALAEDRAVNQHKRQLRSFWLGMIFSAGLLLRVAALAVLDVPLEVTRR